MSAEQVALSAQCAGCGGVWVPDDETGAPAVLIGTEVELVFYCPGCAEREFGERVG